jgi:sec-independent protein translocase protein TatB
MFGVDTTELIIVAIAALLFIGPKELPQTMRTVGRWVGKVRGMARHFSSGIEAVIREAELEEMERKWREENDRIMRDFPSLENQMAVAEGPSQSADLAEPAALSAPEAQANWVPAPEGEIVEGQSHLPVEQRELP